MKYDIVYADHVEELIAIVNNMLSEGWEVLGRPWTEHVSYDNLFWYQAMIKRPVFIGADPIPATIKTREEVGLS